jgi:hypothetical protein
MLYIYVTDFPDPSNRDGRPWQNFSFHQSTARFKLPIGGMESVERTPLEIQPPPGARLAEDGNHLEWTDGVRARVSREGEVVMMAFHGTDGFRLISGNIGPDRRAG